MAGYSVWAVGIVWENFKFYKCAKSPTAPRKYHCGEIHHFFGTVFALDTSILQIRQSV